MNCKVNGCDKETEYDVDEYCHEHWIKEWGDRLGVICSNCGSVNLYLVRQGEYSFKACKDCEHEDSLEPPNKDMESAKIGDTDN